MNAPQVPEVDVHAAAAADAVYLDVREPHEYEAGHAPGTVHAPLGSLAAALPPLPRERRVVVICRSGHRSAHATAFLRAEGYDAVNLAGGMKAWSAAGLPVECDGGAPGVIA